jgi:hypothetical protein
VRSNALSADHNGKFEIGTVILSRMSTTTDENPYSCSVAPQVPLTAEHGILRYGTVTSPPGGVMPKFTQSNRP